ncbi:MAG: class I SAM-dependent methyltransferase [Actinomycetaceae bacterium]|nr:class I SAM-dependent methyltransferase [Actinomycetaceae bacterium]
MNHTPPIAGIQDYTHGHQAAVLNAHADRSATNSCHYFLDRIDKGQRILDLGCGPGSITLDLAELVGPQGHVVGVDFSAEAIALAENEARSRGVRSAEFMVGDLFHLNLEPHSFDIVHAHQVLQHLPDPVSALKIMRDLCIPGGLIAVRDADYAGMTWYPELAGISHWLTIYCASARKVNAEPNTGRYLRAWANAAELTITYIGSSTWTYATPERTRQWGNSQADRVLHSSFARHALESGLQAADLERIAADWRSWGAHPDACFILPHGELLATPSIP